jgi:hypothetical protein
VARRRAGRRPAPGRAGRAGPGRSPGGAVPAGPAGGRDTGRRTRRRGGPGGRGRGGGDPRRRAAAPDPGRRLHDHARSAGRVRSGRRARVLRRGRGPQHPGAQRLGRGRHDGDDPHARRRVAPAGRAGLPVPAAAAGPGGAVRLRPGRARHLAVDRAGQPAPVRGAGPGGAGRSRRAGPAGPRVPGEPGRELPGAPGRRRAAHGAVPAGELPALQRAHPGRGRRRAGGVRRRREVRRPGHHRGEPGPRSRRPVPRDAGADGDEGAGPGFR